MSLVYMRPRRPQPEEPCERPEPAWASGIALAVVALIVVFVADVVLAAVLGDAWSRAIWVVLGGFGPLFNWMWRKLGWPA